MPLWGQNHLTKLWILQKYKTVWLRWKQALFLIPNFHLSFSYLDFFGAVEKEKRKIYIHKRYGAHSHPSGMC